MENLRETKNDLSKEVRPLSSISKDTQSRKYQLTINNPLNVKISDSKDSENKIDCPFTHEEIRKRLADMKSICYWCMADEIGLEEKTPHTHIYFLARSPIRFSTVKRLFPSSHIEPAYGDSQINRDYITKSGKWKDSAKNETSIEGTFEEWGEIPSNEKMGTRGGIQFIYDMIANGMTTSEILKVYPEALLYLDKIDRARQIMIEDFYKDTWRELDVTYIYGKTSTGKTRSVMERYGYSSVYRITDYTHPWDGYQSTRHSVVVFEEFRSSLKIEDMLNYLDGYPCSLVARYNNKVACYLTVYIISNIPLESQYTAVQTESKITWEAFLRRIKRIEHFQSDGTIITYNSVQAYFERDYNFRPTTEEEEKQMEQMRLPLED